MASATYPVPLLECWERGSPDRVIYIHSYSRTLGADLRLAVLSSSASIVEQIHSYRAFSSGWTSRLLQGAVAWLLRDQGTEPLIRWARAIYGERRVALVASLERNGIRIEPGSGLCAWVPVASESFALVTTAAREIAVQPGIEVLRRTDALHSRLDGMLYRSARRCSRGTDGGCSTMTKQKRDREPLISRGELD